MTSTVIAALDSTAAARPVLDTALALAHLSGDSVEALHVSDGTRLTPESLALRRSVRLRVVQGPVDEALLGALDEQATTALVVGARATTGGARPVGRTAMSVLESAEKPVVVVPPVVTAAPSLRRVIVPLEGTESTSSAFLDWAQRLLPGGIEVEVLHVFTDRTIPRMLDQPGYDAEVISSEFLARHMPIASKIEMSTGPVGARIVDVARSQAADLVALSWAGRLSHGRGEVVREVLASCDVPVLLISAGAGSRRSGRP